MDTCQFQIKQHTMKISQETQKFLIKTAARNKANVISKKRLKDSREYSKKYRDKKKKENEQMTAKIRELEANKRRMTAKIQKMKANERKMEAKIRELEKENCKLTLKVGYYSAALSHHGIN